MSKIQRQLFFDKKKLKVKWKDGRQISCIMGGRLTLIKTVLSAMSIHYMQAIKNKDIVKVSTDWQVENGHSIRFWLDRWVGTSALSTVYPNLFDIAYDKQILISQVFSPRGLYIDFCR